MKLKKLLPTYLSKPNHKNGETVPVVKNRFSHMIEKWQLCSGKRKLVDTWVGLILVSNHEHAFEIASTTVQKYLV